MAFSIAELRVYNPRDFFGAVDYEGEHVTWDLLALFGASGSTFAGLCPDPTGNFLMQYPAPVFLDAGTAQWTPAAANQAAYAQAKDATTGKMFLRCAPAAATTAFDTTLSYVRPDDEGFSCQIYRAATTGGTFYLYLSAGRAEGTPGLRLAIEANNPIRLQVSTDDDKTWTDVDTAPLGESESYLTSVGRYLTVDVLSECDPTWTTSSDAPFAPPGQVCVTLNGTTVLTWNGGSQPSASSGADEGDSPSGNNLAGGSVRISGTLGQWSLLSYARKLFAPTGLAGLPGQTRAAFQGDPRTFVSGYQPYDQMTSVEVTAPPSALPTQGGGNGSSPGGGMQVISGGQATAALTITTPDEGLVTAADGNTYAGRTCFLSAAEATWPAIQAAANPAAPYASYEPIYALCETHYDQGGRIVRRRAVCIFQSQDDSYAPGNVIPAARAAQLLMGDITDAQLTPVITGWTAIAALDGQQWQWVDWQKHFAVVIEDRHRKGDDDQVACLHMEPFDYQAHYNPVRKLHHKMGITDEWMTSFPNVDESGLLPDGSQFQGYFLGGGTAQEPLWQPAPDECVNSFLGKVLEVAGEDDPSSGQIQPMVLGDAPDGTVIYDPMPAGIASAFLSPGQTLAQLGLSPIRDFALNDFKVGTLRSAATLSHIRTPVVVEGVSNQNTLLVGIAANQALGGGPLGDPSQFGFVGTNVPYVNISRRFSSPEVVARAVAVAAVTMAFPSIGAEGTLGYLDPSLDVLAVITITDPFTQGTPDPVAYWTQSLRHLMDATNAERRIGETSFSARLLGQAA